MGEMRGAESENEGAYLLLLRSERRLRLSIVQVNLPSAFGSHCGS